MTNLDLCELADVKRRLDITDTTNDTLLADLISAVSVAIERYLDRKLYQEARTEYHHVTRRDGSIVLRSYPVSSIASIKNSSAWDWDNVTALTATNYVADDESGILYFQTTLDVGPRALQVVYTAGLATSAASVASTYPDLASAAEMQVVEEFMRKEAQGDVTISLSDGGSAGMQSGLRLLPAVRERLMPWRRRVL